MDFENAVEAVRIGSIIARSAKAAAKWDARKGTTGKGLTGKSLDQAVTMAGVAAGRARYPGGKPGSNIKTEHVN